MGNGEWEIENGKIKNNYPKIEKREIAIIIFKTNYETRM